MSKLENWIAVYDDVVPNDLGDNCIAFLESNNATKGEYNADWRRCKEFSKFDNSPFYGGLLQIINENYAKYKQEHSNGVLNLNSPNIFHNHADCWNFATATRQISLIVYLNDVDEGGETNFTDLNVKVCSFHLFSIICTKENPQFKIYNCQLDSF